MPKGMKAVAAAEPSSVAAVWVPLSDIKVWEGNPRRNDHAVPRVAESIVKCGWGRTLVARTANNELIAGHTARKAALYMSELWVSASRRAREEKWHPDAVRTVRDGVVPVRFLDIDERKARMLALADNKLGELSDWDDPALLDVMEGYSFEELASIGWSNDEIERLGNEVLAQGEELLGFESAPLDGLGFVSADERRARDAGEKADIEESADAEAGQDTCAEIAGGELPGDGMMGDGEDDSSAEDEIPEPPKAPVTKRGDVWQLGDHVLVCGDCTSAEVASLLPSGMSVSLVSDPPFCSGGYQESQRRVGSVGSESIKDGKHKKIANDRLSSRGYQALIRAVYENFQPLDVHMFTDWKMWPHIFDATEASGLTVRTMVVWKKESPGMGMKWRGQHELVLYGARETPSAQPNRGNVIECRRSKNELHPTQKPVELMEELVRMADGERVVDPFAGSGTTLVACEKLGRRCFAVELDPAYCDVIVERWESLTSGKAERKAG